MSATEIANAVRSGQKSAVETAKAALAQANSVGRDLNAFVTVCYEKAIRQAEAIDDRIKNGESVGQMKLCGVPVAIKDNFCYSDYLTSCGSHILDGFKPPYDATVVSKLIEAGAIIIGKTNMDEFGMGSTSENSYYGPVKNPLNENFVAGGSSGGSAAAVAAGIVPLSFGSETGGSIRQPASFCGLYGLKPSYGAVSRYGLVAYGSSLDQIGPMAGNIDDLALALSVIAGKDEMDSTSVDYSFTERPKVDEEEKKLTIGLPEEFISSGLDSDVEKVLRSRIKELEDKGHTIKSISLPLTDKAVAAYYVIACAEASSNLARFDGVRFGLREGNDEELSEMYSATRSAGFGDEVKRRIMLGTYVLSSGYYEAYYRKASQVRQLIRREYEAAFEKVDLIIGPTSPTPAFPVGEVSKDTMTMYLSDVYTVPANLVGLPSISIPSGFSDDGRAIGVQFLAPAFKENRLFDVARILQ